MSEQLSGTLATISPPLPLLEGLTAEFYAFCKAGELRFQKCSDCAAWRHVPRLHCGGCNSTSWRWERSSGQGVIYSLTTVYRALHPGLDPKTPFICAVVEMSEGVRVVSEILVGPGQVPEIGTRVAVVFDAVTQEVTLPKFRMTGRQ